MDIHIDYYLILDLDQSSSISEIKASFRNKLKQLHPDLRGDIKEAILQNAIQNTSSNNELLKLIQAYMILSNPIERKRYDQHYLPISSYIKKKKRVFDYEKFLHERQNIFSYRVKLLMYDLVYKSGEQAVSIFEEIHGEGKKLLLKSELGSHDYIDCLVLIAEYYNGRLALGDIDKSLVLYREIFYLERKINYFKDYITVLIEELQSLLEAYLPRFANEPIQQKNALNDIFSFMETHTLSKSSKKKMRTLQKKLLYDKTNR